MAGLDAAGGSQAKRVIFAEEIRDGKGQVFLVLGEAALHGCQNIGFSNSLTEGRRKGAQKAQPALADDPVRFLRDHAQHARDVAVVAAERAVGEGVIGLFPVATALQKEQQCFVPGGDAGAEDGLDARTDVAPYLGPDFPRRFAQRPRVLLAEAHRGVGVVVEESQFRTPPHPHRETRSEQDADDGAETLRPVFDRTKRGGGPIRLPHERAEFAAACEGIAG